MKIKFMIIVIILTILACSPMEMFGEIATEVPPIVVPTFTPELPAVIEPSAVITKLEEGVTYTVSVGNLNLRKCGNIECPIVTVLKLGDQFTVLSSDDVDPWCLIDFNGIVGWINTSYTTKGE